MGVPSCPGFDCALFVVAVGVFFLVAGAAAVLAGSTASELARALSSRFGLQRRDLPIRIAGSLAGVWLTLQLVEAMKEPP